MSFFAVLLLCVQACLVQQAFGQYLNPYFPAAAPAIAPLAAVSPLAPFGYSGLAGACPNAALAPYGGAGEGNVAVAGELPVAGTTVVAGQVPIMGAVSFGGPVPAAGAVSIAGSCSCGCADYLAAPWGYAGWSYMV